jgi:hypothetical protein
MRMALAQQVPDSVSILLQQMLHIHLLALQRRMSAHRKILSPHSFSFFVKNQREAKPERGTYMEPRERHKQITEHTAAQRLLELLLVQIVALWMSAAEKQQGGA